MKLVKITDDHYIIVDDSEIKEDCYALHEGPLGEREIVTANGQCKLDKKITYSTIPKGMMLMEGVKRLSLQEVKELLGEVDVEKKAEEWFLINQYNQQDMIHSHIIPEYITTKNLWVTGYNQAIEDNKEKKYTEEDMIECWKYASIDKHQVFGDHIGDQYLSFIRSLQPPTSWEVEFDSQGKLKLN